MPAKSFSSKLSDKNGTGTKMGSFLSLGDMFNPADLEIITQPTWDGKHLIRKNLQILQKKVNWPWTTFGICERNQGVVCVTAKHAAKYGKVLVAQRSTNFRY